MAPLAEKSALPLLSGDESFSLFILPGFNLFDTLIVNMLLNYILTKLQHPIAWSGTDMNRIKPS
jgi:hypothetical protein